jgi:3-oxoacyl-[acyl-carrier protein] reductase
MTNLAGKVAIVTGSSRGIGAATAERLAQDGATVVVNYVASADKAAAVVDRIKQAGGNAIAIQADVGDWSQAQMLVEKTADELGRLDVLVNNAVQTVGREPLEDITEEFTRQQFAVNILGPIAAIQAAAPLLPSGGGRIINISSCVTVYPLPCTWQPKQDSKRRPGRWPPNSVRGTSPSMRSGSDSPPLI